MTELLKDLISIPEHVHKGDFVLKLTEGVTEDRAQATLRDYVVTPQLADAFDQALLLIKGALEPPPSSKAAYLHGSFGAGKSHFMAVLHLLLQHHPAARAHPKLQPLLAKHASWIEGKKFLLVPYHMIDARSLESAVLGGYVEHVRRLHPKAPLPSIYRADDMLEDAKRLRERMGDHGFFAALNTAREGAEEDSGWGDMAVTWDAARFEEALKAPPRSELRGELISDLIQTLFSSYRSLAAGEGEQVVGIDEGLAALSQHAKRLGYDALILFLDELVLWLATRMADHDFVRREGNKVVKLVEATTADRPIPIVSLVARQRDLRELVGTHLPGSEHLAFADVLDHKKGRFGVVRLEDRNLPAIAGERLLRAKDAGARQRLEAAFEETTRVRTEVLNVLQTREADRALFKQVYPFSPAFLQALVAVSSALQRERTALKMLALYLVEHRDDLALGQVVPVGDLFDLISDGDEPFSADLRIHFENARRLFVQKLLPLLEREHQLRWDEAKANPQDPKAQALVNDARLVKTLLLAALVPEVESFKDLTAGRLAALNHGTIRSPIPNQEARTALAKLRKWASQVGELRPSDDGPNPTFALQVTGVETETILEKAKVHDNGGNRRRLAKALIFRQLGLDDHDELFLRHDLVWKGTERQVDIVFGNVRELTFDMLRARDDLWKVVVDFPFDDEGYTPRDDEARLRAFGSSQSPSRTICWLPDFLGPDAQRDLGRLVILDHVLAGERFDQYASHLSQVDRQAARLILENQQSQLRQHLINVFEAAYGLPGTPKAALDTTHPVEEHLLTLDPSFAPRPPVGANLSQAFKHLVGQALAHQFPAHPDFGAENADEPIKLGQVKKVAAELVRVAEEGDQGRAEVKDKTLRPLLRRIAQPLGLGTMHEVAFELEHHWPQHVDRCLAKARSLGDSDVLTVGGLRAFTDQPEPRGLPRWAQDLVAIAVAAQTGRAFYLEGAPVEVTVGALEDALVLREESLPSEEVWKKASARASAILGCAALSSLRNARNVAHLAQQVGEVLESLRTPAQELVARLKEAAGTLGLTQAVDRQTTAGVAQALVERVLAADARDRLSALAQVDLGGRTEQVLGASLKQAGSVAGAIRDARWEILQAAFGIVKEPFAGQAAELKRELVDAFGKDEFVLKQGGLPVVLREIERRAVKLITDAARRDDPPISPPPGDPPIVQPPIVKPKPAGTKRVSDQKQGLDLAAARAVFKQLEAALEKPGAKLHLSWTLESPEGGK